MLSPSAAVPNISAVNISALSNVTPIVSSLPHLASASVKANATGVLTPNISGVLTSNITDPAKTNVTALIASGVQQSWAAPMLAHSVLAMAVFAGSFVYMTQLKLPIRSLREQVTVKEWAMWLPSTCVIFAQNYLWGCYGFYIGALGIARFNFMGAIVCLASLGVVAKYVQPRETVQPITLLSILTIVMFSIGVLAISHDACRTFAVSATIFSIGAVMLSSREFIRAVQYGAWEQLPMTLIVSSFFQHLFLAQYSVLIHDSFYLVPNTIGILVFGAQLLVVHWLVGINCVLVGKNAAGLREGEDQPLMPRKRGKSSMSNCNSFLSLFGGQQHDYGTASRGRRNDCEFGLPNRFAFSDDNDRQVMSGKQLQVWNSGMKADAFTKSAVQKSPFTPFDKDEDMDEYEPEFEPHHSEEKADENAASNTSCAYITFTSARGIDCIL